MRQIVVAVRELVAGKLILLAMWAMPDRMLAQVGPALIAALTVYLDEIKAERRAA